jgi:ubiquinone/menaquinone biosynthesis C-methylase UbiE
MEIWARLWAAGFDWVGQRMMPVQGPHRRRIIQDAPGEVLEIGAGTGLNFAFYRAAQRVVAIEPGDALRRRAERRARTAPVRIEVRPGNAHNLEFPDASFDTVIFSLVLCTIPDPARALAEARRVLRPGGEIRFYEHVRAEDAALARRQDRWERPWKAFNRGCHPNRDSVATIERAGFALKEVDRFDQKGKGMPKIVRPHVIGVAVRG